MSQLLNRKWLIVALVLLMMPTFVLGHPEHGFNRPEAEDQSKREIERLVVEQKLPEMWNNAFLDLDKSGIHVINHTRDLKRHPYGNAGSWCMRRRRKKPVNKNILKLLCPLWGNLSRMS